jgi:hypothetical protein
MCYIYFYKRMLCLYRLSDLAQTPANKPKIPEATKLVCLRNFIDVFGKDHLYIIADRVSSDTIAFIKSTMHIADGHIIETDYGSGGHTFLHAARLAKESSLPDNAPVYFVEDDYLHQSNSLQIMLEGLNITNVDYVTAYDHPDKYMVPLQTLTSSYMYTTGSTHWRTVPSTTMTFATTIGKVRRDYPVYEEYCHTGYPYDDAMFRTLQQKGRRSLVSCIPGASTHIELLWLSPFPKVGWTEVAKKYTEA